MCLRCAQAAAVGDGHVHAAPSVMRVLTDFARLAPASYREFGLSWQTPITDDQMQVPDVKPGGLQISLVRGRGVLTAVTCFWGLREWSVELVSLHRTFFWCDLVWYHDNAAVTTR